MKRIKKSKPLTLSLSLVLVFSILINFTGCMNIKAVDLMDGVEAQSISDKPADDKFISGAADFAVELFKKSTVKNGNSLVSPLSVMLALSMTANGADGETRAQMETLLGGGIGLDELNQYMNSYAESLPSEKDSKLSIANSIWFKDVSSLSVKKDFLQKNADYYGAAAYKSAFDAQTLSDINNWIEKNTDGMIKNMIDSIDEQAVMFLINAVAFDAKWEKVYTKKDIAPGQFNTADGSEESVDMMTSDETKYIDDGEATGFIKPYKNNKYSFVGLLPKTGTYINKYISSLTGEKLMSAVKGAQNSKVTVKMPAFTSEYKINLNDVLMEMGMPDAFNVDMADFSSMAESTDGNICIGKVLHQTYISVDANGTKAAAATSVRMDCNSAEVGNYVTLDRPFVYAIIDNSTNLPVFIGAMMNPEK